MSESFEESSTQSRDRILIMLAAIGILACSVYLLKPELFQFGSGKHGDTLLGLLQTEQGDVRLKGANSNVWGRGNVNQKLYEYDSIYVGEKSQAGAIVLQNHLTIKENTLLVLHTKLDGDGVLNLDYGTIESELAGGQEFKFKGSDDKTFKVTAKKESHIVLTRAPKGDVQVSVQSGEASVSDATEKVDVQEKQVATLQKDKILKEAPRAPAQAAPEVKPEIKSTAAASQPLPEQSLAPVAPVGHTFDAEIHIPLKDYPEKLYALDDAVIRAYLARSVATDFFSSFQKQEFPLAMSAVNARGLQYQFYVQSNALPSTLLYPNTYRFQLSSDHTPHDVNVVLDPSVMKVAAVQDQPVADWHPQVFARAYEFQTSPDAKFSKPSSENVLTPSFPLAKQPNLKGFARVRAVDDRGRPISDWSNSEAYEVLSDQSNVAFSPRRTAAVDESASENKVNLSGAEEALSPYDPHFWAWVGTGLRISTFNESIPNQASVNSNSAQGPGFALDAAYIAPNMWGGEFLFRQDQSRSDFANVSADSPTATWRTMSAWALWKRPSLSSKTFDSIYPVWKFGVAVQDTPFFSLSGPSSLQLQNLRTIAPDVQYVLYMSRKRWLYQAGGGYSLPLNYSVDGSSANGSTWGTIEGVLGTSYRLNENLQGGLYWTGQYSSQKVDTGISNQENILRSNLDLRFGYGF